jgi:RimJ/RimL family protein N-acetyltransferase
MFARAVTPGDVHDLAELMLDAYRNTIDFEGEGFAEAVVEVEGYFSRAAKHPAISQHSLVLGFRESIVCACLIEFWERRNVPLVGYVMCRSPHKQKGLATFALHQTIGRLKSAGHSELRAIITEGNYPSEALFAPAGFHRVDR